MIYPWINQPACIILEGQVSYPYHHTPATKHDTVQQMFILIEDISAPDTYASTLSVKSVKSD